MIDNRVLRISKQFGVVADRFDSVNEAAEVLGVPASTIYGWVRYKTVTKGSFIYRYERHWNGYEKFNIYGYRPVIVFDREKVQLDWYSDIYELSKALKLSRRYLAGKVTECAWVCNGRYKLMPQRDTKGYVHALRALKARVLDANRVS